MRTGGGLFLILGGITALYLYNTGRLEAVLRVIKDPTAPVPVKNYTQTGSAAGATNTSGGGYGIQNAAQCAAVWSGGNVAGGVGCALQGLTHIADLKGSINKITGLIGIKL